MKIKNSLLTNTIVGSFVMIVILKIQTLLLFNLLINNTPFIFNQWMQIIITFKDHTWNKDFLSYFPTIVLPCSWPISEDTRWRVLSQRTNIKGNILWAFLSSYFFKKERKKSKTWIRSFFMLEAKHEKS